MVGMRRLSQIACCRLVDNEKIGGEVSGRRLRLPIIPDQRCCKRHQAVLAPGPIGSHENINCAMGNAVDIQGIQGGYLGTVEHFFQFGLEQAT